MPEIIQELIDKIKKEGIDTAKENALNVEKDANEKALHIISQAKKEASDIINQAKSESEKLHHSTIKSLENASRDMLISLRKQINDNFKSILSKEVKGALTREALSEILIKIINGFMISGNTAKDITFTLNPNELNLLKEGIISKLQDKLKSKVTFEPSDEIVAGFTVSFDSKASTFDFTDESLVTYLCAYLNSNTGEILKAAVK